MADKPDFTNNTNPLGVDLDAIYSLGNSWIEFGDRLTEHIHALTDAVGSMNWNGAAGSAMLDLWDGGNPFSKGPGLPQPEQPKSHHDVPNGPPPAQRGPSAPGWHSPRLAVELDQQSNGGVHPDTVQAILFAARDIAYQMGGQINAYGDAVNQQIKKMKEEAIAEIIIGVVGAVIPFALAFFFAKLLEVLGELVFDTLDKVLGPTLRLLGVSARFSNIVTRFAGSVISGATINTIVNFGVNEIVYLDVTGAPWTPTTQDIVETVVGGGIFGGVFHAAEVFGGPKNRPELPESAPPDPNVEESPPPYRDGTDLGGPDGILIPPRIKIGKLDEFSGSDIPSITDSEIESDIGPSDGELHNLPDGSTSVGPESDIVDPNVDPRVDPRSERRSACRSEGRSERRSAC